MNSDINPPYRTWLTEIDQVKSVIVKAETAVQKGKDVAFLEAKQKSLELAYSQYVARWANLVDAVAANDIDLDLFAKEHQSISGSYNDCLEKVADAINTNRLTSNPLPSSSGSTPGKTLRLPDIKLPDFHGDVEAFPQFWELFSSLVYDRADLSVALKFTYLKSCLKGPGARVLAGFPVDAHNYSQAKQLLQDTYKDERVRRTLILQLINIKSPGHNAKELSEFRITFNQVIRSLGANNDVNGALWFIKDLLQAKVSKDTQSFLFQREKAQYFSYEAFNKGLQVLINLLETTSHNSSKREHAGAENHTSKLVSGSSSPKAKLAMQATSSNSTATSASKNSTCFFCKEAHPSIKCPTYLTPTDRKNALYQNKRCFKCGGGNH